MPPRCIDDDVAGAVDAAVGLLPREVSA